MVGYSVIGALPVRDVASEDSSIPLPGGRRTMISGIGVFYPDRTPTQRVGIVSDLEAIPTVAGIRAGRDEVLDTAVNHLLNQPRVRRP